LQDAGLGTCTSSRLSAAPHDLLVETDPCFDSSTTFTRIAAEDASQYNTRPSTDCAHEISQPKSLSAHKVYAPRTPPEDNVLSFARRLHLVSAEAAYQLACKGEERYEDYQRVFSLSLLMYTRQELISILSEIRRNGYTSPLQIPWTFHHRAEKGTGQGQWFNPTDVALYCHHQGLHYDQETDSLVGNECLKLDLLRQPRKSVSFMVTINVTRFIAGNDSPPRNATRQQLKYCRSTLWSTMYGRFRGL
jgi:hypothetical protein